jgi:3-deoxy-D-arabino-heptulosonate 7-phosphate (DAHP) synthase
MQMVLAVALTLTTLLTSCGSSSGSGESKVVNGVGQITYTVPDSYAGEKVRTFNIVSEIVYDFLASNSDANSLDIKMLVECEDIYGNKKMKESHVKVGADAVTEMRKFKSSSALSDDCMDWQIAFEVGYKMCGQID